MAKVIMWLCILGFIAAFVLLAAGVAAYGAAQAMKEADPATALARAEAARHAAEMNRIREQQAVEWAATTAQVVNVVKWPFTLSLIALMTLTVAGLMLRGSMRAQDHAEFVSVDGIPYSRPLALAGGTHVMAVERVRATGEADIQRAMRANLFPAPVDGSKVNYIYKEGNQPARVDALPAPQADATPQLSCGVAVPSLVETLRLAAPGEFILGFTDDGRPIKSDLDGIGATLILGERGMGKSTEMAALALFAARMRATVFVVDRHARRRDSLAQRLDALDLSHVAWQATQMDALVGMWETEYKTRLDDDDPNPAPWVLLVDEINNLALDPETRAVAERVGRLTELIGNAGRKLNLGVIAGAQLATNERLKSKFAFTASTVAVFRANPTMVRPFIPGVPDQTFLTLERGQAVTLHPGGIDVVRVPRAEPDDIRAATALLDRRGEIVKPRGGGASDGRSWGVGGATGCNRPPLATAETPPPPDNQLQPVVSNSVDNSARIRELYAQGMNKTAICREVFGYKDGATWDAVEVALSEKEDEDE